MTDREKMHALRVAAEHIHKLPLSVEHRAWLLSRLTIEPRDNQEHIVSMIAGMLLGFVVTLGVLII